ncbi:hypothetical protein CG723_27925 [Streptomyces sp. CB01635]|uniref:hypothetical protein n=1 Tax=unclassified Streptomyces TaxID=2593676 RepID=UPI000C2719F3|nr:hypothetical protein [Streptomyces sp. CB01635]PJN08591.1 hypothetical protein CG723_27925 [Streptomyces sp. CB01635]
MSLPFGPDRQTREFECECCNAPIERAWNFICSDGEPYAVYFANCYHHRDRDHDAWIDVIFGTWGTGQMPGLITSRSHAVSDPWPGRRLQLRRS